MRFIVTGTGHSGTGYISEVFNRLGFECGHEGVFSVEVVQKTGFDGDASALAVPRLGGYQDCVIFHQLRHPLDFIRSQMADVALFGNHFGGFLLKNCPDAAQYQSGSRPTLAWSARFWIDWNLMVEPHSDLRYRLEDMSPRLLESMCAMIGEWRSGHEVVSAIEGGLKKRNPHARPDDPAVTWGDLERLPFYDELIEQARRYGYKK